MAASTADYHVHTRLCRHAQGEPREYVERAIELGLDELGFADHLPFLGGWSPGYGVPDDWAMGLDELDGYVTLVQDLAAEYRRDIVIRLGIEADYIEATLEETAAVLREYPFEYVIGSVHLVGDFPFDHPAMRDRIGEYGADRVQRESLESVAAAAASGLFDVMGHIDQARKYAGPPQDGEGVAAAAARALRAIAAAGVALELNTSGYRQPAGDAYPAAALLRQAAALRIPLVCGSDAHSPEHVGFAFDRAAQAAAAAGYTSWLQLSRAGECPC